MYSWHNASAYMAAITSTEKHSWYIGENSEMALFLALANNGEWRRRHARVTGGGGGFFTYGWHPTPAVNGIQHQSLSNALCIICRLLST